MPRKLRLQHSGAIYHVMNRGDRREKICKDALRSLRADRLAGACLLPDVQSHWQRTIPQGTPGADQSWAGKLRRGHPFIGGVESLKRIEIELKGG
jgi:hypothetical protein